eukprot:TRINITY_DN6790_c0_g1_i1.p1 TRINITY_DN6790_c0_g1~~TRINITY_DN6790_c0_g1_i1.p1  ORF type:complete len:266 (-),score=59.21 TRINITY_DN6790_c0_g1_i1:121-918(-)
MSLQQQDDFTEKKAQYKKEHESYLQDHPELKQILNDFVADCLLRKPEDVFVHARDYFAAFASGYRDASDSHHRPLVLCGPSGVGKSTLVKKLLEEFPGVFGFAVSHTTRKPRGGEQHGREYFFVDEANFKKGIEENAFIEHANVHGNFYGTSKATVREQQSKGQICILDIDVQGVRSVKKTDLNPRYVFIAPPAMATLEQRLRDRNTDTEQQIEKRLETARKEMEAQEREKLCEVTVVNDNLDEAYAKLRAVIVEDAKYLMSLKK